MACFHKGAFFRLHDSLSKLTASNKRRGLVKIKVLLLLAIFVYLIDPVWAQTAQGDLTELSMEDLMNIEIYSAAKKSEPVFDTPAAVYVITQEDIRRSGTTSVARLLRRVPGMIVQKVNSNTWDISARGFNGSIFSNKLLVLIDGRAVYTPLFGGVFWDVQNMPVEDIERVEVIRGPGGTMWGANAVNGVINIITKHPKDTQKTMLVAGGGTEENVFGGARVGGKADDWYYRTYVKYFNRDESFSPSGQTRDGWDGAQTGFRAQKDQWNVQGDFYEAHFGNQVIKSSFTPPFTSLFDESTTGHGANLLTRFEDEDWYAQAYWDMTDRELVTINERRDKFDLDYHRRLIANAAHEVSFGLNYRIETEEISNTDSIVIDTPDKLDQLFAVLVQDEITVTDALKFTIGSKVEHNIYTDFEFEPSVRAIYSLSEKSNVWTAVSRAIRTPSRIESDATILGATSAPTLFTLATPSDDLDAEKLIAYEAGYRNQMHDKLSFDLSVFANHYDDLITYTFGPTVIERGFSTLKLPVRNALSAESHGLETAADFRITEWWKMHGSYSLSQLDIHPSSDTTVTDIGLEAFLENGFARQYAFLEQGFNLPGQMELTAMVYYTSAFGRIKSVTTMDLNLTKVINDWEISLIGQNLLVPHHLESNQAGATRVERGGYVKVKREF
jgi:iron complex outermembrane recepter protein